MMGDNWKIRLQADDFFEAYKVLKEHGDNGGLTIMTPTIVILAFTLELYIKDLYHVLDIAPPRGRDGHNILELYKKLPPDAQQDIFEHKLFDQKRGLLKHMAYSYIGILTNPSDMELFTQHLKLISDAFQKWRYSYEHTTLQYNTWFAEELIEVVRSVADRGRAKSKKLDISGETGNG